MSESNYAFRETTGKNFCIFTLSVTKANILNSTILFTPKINTAS